ADTLEHVLEMRPATRAELVGCGINSIPNPPYISGHGHRQARTGGGRDRPKSLGEAVAARLEATLGLYRKD
ncbi:MAG: hypothetical protein ACREIG_01065, partial [Nitrospiraceae bacterium]